MLDVKSPLFHSQRIVLGPIDQEADATIESRWMHDAGYQRMLGGEPAIPRSASEIKKIYDEIEKSQEEKHDPYYFTIRMRSDGRLIGFGKLYGIMWVNSYAWIQLGIGEPADRRHGYGSEALKLMLRFAFSELNLFRLSAMVPEYNLAALGLFQQFGFVEEVRRRQALERDGRRWDMIELGFLASEWSQTANSKTGLIREVRL